ncbi:hypothetical protein GLOIN_2v1776024 [Rhizophagus clarus]|uniref:Uncharacterized protein n=1 Tax=Rhizophagus clarus TaxID=94130 RepID=A0A8H3QK70_9GLOM|nr:hypothetical protein GLOIN_2v1776024 [Rhizophagus clarus]
MRSSNIILKSNNKLAKTKNKSTKKIKVFTKEKENLSKELNKYIAKISVRSDDLMEDGEEDDISEFSEVENYDIDEIKTCIIIEKKNKKTSTFKTIIIKPVEYINVIEKINEAV